MAKVESIPLLNCWDNIETLQKKIVVGSENHRIIDKKKENLRQEKNWKS